MVGYHVCREFQFLRNNLHTTALADMPATIDAIVASSDLPMSIVIIGVHGPVSACVSACMYVICNIR
jgi:hypothetical protein